MTSHLVAEATPSATTYTTGGRGGGGEIYIYIYQYKSCWSSHATRHRVRIGLTLTNIMGGSLLYPIAWHDGLIDFDDYATIITLSGFMSNKQTNSDAPSSRVFVFVYA